MTGRQYADLIAAYLVQNFGHRGVEVYREVPLGKTIIGKDRKIDVLVLHRQTGRALAIECKFQDSQGTTDEKIPYALGDLEALRIPSCLVYAGEGFSPGIRHMMAASHLAAECLPMPGLVPGEPTRELDHILAMTFEWWDLVVRGRTPVTLEGLARAQELAARTPRRLPETAEPCEARPLAIQGAATDTFRAALAPVDPSEERAAPEALLLPSAPPTPTA